jgi:hypothetical protein
MTDQNDEARAPSTAGTQATVGAVREPFTRRALLRGAAIAAPTIVTMNTASAALAMTSVRTYTSSDAPQADGNFYCLEEKSTLGPPLSGNPNALQLNSTSMPKITTYQERDYRTADNSSASTVTEVQMCRSSGLDGTMYYYKSTGWNPITVKRGILMSAAAMGSLAVTAVKIDNL